MKTAIVVLNWNGADDTRDCVASLLKMTDAEFEIFVIDNDSHDEDTHQILDSLAADSKVHVIYNPHNDGFAGGVNVGIREALKGDFTHVALFNNDAVADKDWLAELHKAASVQKSGITTGLLLHRDGKTIDSSGDFCSMWGLPFPRDRDGATKYAPYDGPVFSGSGGASLYSCDMLREIGLFDESFFMYYEDTDISFRAQLYGYEVYYTSTAVAYHKQGASSDKVKGLTAYHTFKNLPLFYGKNMPTGLLWATGWRFWFAYTMILGNAIKNGNGIPALKGYFVHIWLFWTKALPARLSIQKHKKATASEIKAKLWPELPPDQTGMRKLVRAFNGKK